LNILKILAPSFLRNFGRRKLHSLSLRSRNNKPLVYAQNHWIEIYEQPSCSELYKRKIYEPDTTLFFRDYLKEGDIVYDVGANIGYFSLEFARLIGTTGKVLCFEPHPEIFEVLTNNVRRNGYKNIRLHNVACSESNSKQRLYFSSENEGNHKIIENEKSSQSVDIQAVRLDSIITLNPPSLIKMDIEGAELLALKGIGDDFLAKSKVDFVIEYHPYEMSFFGVEGVELLDFFSHHGYKFRNLAYDNFPIISKEEILANYRKEDYGITNLFCSKLIDCI
jgi:FkbM family methyltransferase